MACRSFRPNSQLSPRMWILLRILALIDAFIEPRLYSSGSTTDAFRYARNLSSSRFNCRISIQGMSKQPTKVCRPEDPTMIVYRIWNRVTNMSYIGQSKQCFFNRYGRGYGKRESWWKYVTNDYLKNSIKVHGHENFEFEILASNIESLEKLDELERQYIKQFGCIYPHGYNYSYGGQTYRCDGLSQFTRDKIAQTHSGHKLYRLLNNQTGQIHEFVNVNRFSQEHGLLNPSIFRVLSGEQTNHRVWSLPDKPIKRIELVSATGEEVSVMYEQMGIFCKKHGITQGNLSGVLSGRNRTAKGWRLKNPVPHIGDTRDRKEYRKKYWAQSKS